MSEPVKIPCPRHGTVSLKDLSGLRCHCLSIVMEALGGLKGGKWVRGALQGLSFAINSIDKRAVGEIATGHHIEDEFADAVEERAKQAIEEAVAAAYQLGLRGGVPKRNVVACSKCARPRFFDDRTLELFGSSPSHTCPACYARTQG